MASLASQPGRRAQEIASALQQTDITTLDLWTDLDTLSTHTTIEAIEVPPEGIVVQGHRFSAVLNLYLSLQYGTDDDERFTISDSFRARVEGTLADGSPVVDQSSVDTSSFYE